MSQKKRKKPRDVGKDPKKLQHSGEAKQFDPLAHNILCVDMVLLAAAQWMYNEEMISETVSGIATVVGLILLIVALYLQFGPKDNKPKAPRL